MASPSFRLPAEGNQQSLTGVRKAAVFLVAVGDELGKKILQNLAEADVQRLTEEIADLRNIPPELSLEVVEEFREMLETQQYMVHGGIDYPPIDIIESISRLMPSIVTDEHARAAATVRRMLSAWARSEDLVRIGAYKAGTDAVLDCAMKFRPVIREFLAQRARERETFADARAQVMRLAAAIDAGGAA